MEDLTFNFEVGQKVMIIDSNSYHRYEIGTIVYVDWNDPCCPYSVKLQSGRKAWMSDDDIQLFN